jgi:hypothetical protein
MDDIGHLKDLNSNIVFTRGMPFTVYQFARAVAELPFKSRSKYQKSARNIVAKKG